MPPAGTLTGLAKRALPGVETVALKTPDDLDAARDLGDTPRQRGPHGRLADLADARLARARAPSTGAVDRRSGDLLEPGAAVGAVVTPRDEQPVVAPHGGTVVEWLVEDGDPVSPGQPLVRLHPEEVPA